MRKPTYAEAYMYKNFLWLAVAVFAFIPFLNNFLLQFLYLYTEGDIAYGSLGVLISSVKSVLSVSSVYIGLGVLITAVINFGKNSGRRLRELAEEDPGFLRWMLRSDFSDEVKEIIKNALAGEFPVRKK